MQRSLLFIQVCLFCLFAITLQAKTYKDRGFYGSLSFLYWDEDVSSNTSYQQQDFTQEYKLGYMGNVYNPKLMTYKVEGKIRYDQLVNKNNTSESTTKTDSQDYNVNVDFIQATRFPFSIYMSKGKKPLTRIDTTGAYSYLYTSEVKGFNGGMKFKPFSINYGASSSTNITDSTLFYQDIKTDIYYTSLKHGEQKYDYSVEYSHLKQKISKEETNVITDEQTYTSTRQINDSIDLRYRREINENLVLSTSANYLESDYTTLNSKNLGVNANLLWTTEKLNASFSGSATRVDSTTYSDGNISTTTNRFDTFNLSESLTYRLTESVTLSQSLSDYMYENQTVKGDIKNFLIGASHSYRKEVTDYTTVSFYTNVYMQNITTELTSKTDTNDTFESINKYNLNLKATVTDNMPVINSIGRVKAEVYDMETSTAESIRRYSIDFALMTKFYYIFRNNISVGGSQNETTRVVLDVDGVNDHPVTSITSKYDLSETIAFDLRIGAQGKFSFLAGVNYSNTNYDGVVIGRTQPLADIKLNYRVSRHMMYFAGFHVDRDLAYDYTNYIGTTKFTYKIGRTSFLATYRYNKTEVGASSDRQSYQRGRLDLKLVRTF